MIEPARRLITVLGLLLALGGLQAGGCASNVPADARPQMIRNADLQLSKGVDYYNQSEYAKAADAFERALFSYRAIDNQEGIAASSINMAKTSLARGEPHAAAQWLDSAQHVIDRNERTGLSSRVTIIRSSIAIENDELDAARELLNPLLTAAPGSLDVDTLRAAVQNRTRVAFAEQREMAAWTDRYAALASHDSPLQQARLARFRAALAEDDKTADRNYSSALEQYRAIAHRPGIAATLFEWSGALMQRGDYGAATDMLSRALFIRATMMDASEVSTILQRLAEMHKTTQNRQAFNATRVWIGKVNSDDFNDWQGLTESYSVYPVK